MLFKDVLALCQEDSFFETLEPGYITKKLEQAYEEYPNSCVCGTPLKAGIELCKDDLEFWAQSPQAFKDHYDL